MTSHRTSKWIRYGSYPLLFGGGLLTLVLVATHRPEWTGLMPIVVAVAVATVAVLERLQPHRADWAHDQGDTRTDAVHLVVNYALVAGVALGLEALPGGRHWSTVWPSTWPVALQVLLAGTVFDLGLYAMHRASHRVPWLWRLHAIHHSPRRLYWMNGERRHPLSAIVLAGPGLIVLVALGAPGGIVGTWLGALTIHLAFQHANLDYSVGPLRGILAIAESHRPHHHRDAGEAQVNYGEFWLVWDRLFGTFAPSGPADGACKDVGLEDERVPRRWLAQMRWPFTPRA